MARAIAGWNRPVEVRTLPDRWTAAEQERFLPLADRVVHQVEGDLASLRVRAFEVMRRTPVQALNTERNQLSRLVKALDLLDAVYPNRSTPEHELDSAAVDLVMTRVWAGATSSSYNTVYSGLKRLAQAANPSLWPREAPKGGPRPPVTRPYSHRQRAALYDRASAVHESLSAELLVMFDLAFEAAATPFEIGQCTAGDVNGINGRASVHLISSDGVLRVATITGPPATRLLTKARELERNQWLLRPNVANRSDIVWSTSELVRKHDKAFAFNINAARHRCICDALDQLRFRARTKALGITQKSHLVHDLLPFMKED